MNGALMRAWRRLLSGFHGRTLDRELDAEIELHLANAIEENVRLGMGEEEARRRALLRFGTVAQAKEQQRESRGLPALDILRQDIRYTLRSLRRDKAFAFVTILVLALGIGANVAVFSVVNTILFRPLPFRNPGRLVWLATNDGKGGLSDQTYTVAAYEEFRRHNKSFEDVTSYQTFFNSVQYKLVGAGVPVPLTGVEVAENFFPMLGVEPMLGRQFTAEECRKGGPPAVLLSYGFWRRQFGGDARIVGRTIGIDAAPANISGPVTVAGVLPASFDFGSVFSPALQVDIFVPAAMDFWRTWGNTLAVIGRLKPGVELSQAQAEAAILFPHLREMHKDWFSDYKSKLFGLQDHVSGKLRRSLVALWCAVGLMLMIVCINISNLLLARAMSRSKEFAMRTALGAGRGRLIRQLLTESGFLSVSGAVFGLSFAWAITFYLARQTRVALPLLATVRIDGTALLWTIAITAAVAVVFGLAPAFKASVNLQDALKDSGAGLTRGSRHERLRAALVVSEVALACVLLIGAGLLLRSFVRLLDVDLGFRPEHVAALKIELPDGGRKERRAPLVQQILDRVRALPGIEAAGITDMLPLERNRQWGLVSKENLNDKQPHGAFVYVVSPGYLAAMGMRLTRGRDISPNAIAGAPCELVIDEAAARREWPGRDPIGQPAYGAGCRESKVVGVIADVRESNPENAAGVQMYVAINQANPEGTDLVVRTRLPLATIEPAILSLLRSLNPGQPLTQFRAIDEIVEHAVSPRRFLMVLVSAFAAFGLVLASLGIYGVISYSVTRQAQEIGIRMALGASAARVRLGILGQTLRLAVLGIAAGAVASFAVAKGIAALLFGTEPADPLIFTATMSLLMIVALIAGQIPARRASRIDPMTVLRGL